MNSLLTSLPVVMPIACAWAEKQELIILAQGAPLGEGRLADARRAGVAHPEKIRLLRVEALPQPENEDMMFIAKHIGLFSPRSSGIALGYGICLKHIHCANRYSLVHECVHVAKD